MASKRNRKLTAKQETFVREYLIDLNASAAAKRAGYSPKMADRIGFQLLENTRVKEAIRAAMAERERRTEVTSDMTVEELAEIAFSNITDFVVWGPGGVRLKDTSGLPEGKKRCIESVKETQSGVAIKMHSKIRALELLMRHQGLLNDKLEVTGGEVPGLVVNVVVPEQGEDINARARRANPDANG